MNIYNQENYENEIKKLEMQILGFANDTIIYN